MVSRGETAEPAFLMWRTPKEDMDEALSKVTSREDIIRDRVLKSVMGTGPKMSKEDVLAYEKEKKELNELGRKLILVKQKELQEKEWLKPIPVPARAADIWEDAAKIDEEEKALKAQEALERAEVQKKNIEGERRKYAEALAGQRAENLKMKRDLYAGWLLSEDAEEGDW